MTRKTRMMFAASALLLTGTLASGPRSAHAADVADTAMAAPQFTTLVAAVQAAGIAQNFKGKGPITVFAPTNAAFEKLPPGTVENLLKPENKATLVRILNYHVVAGRLQSTQLAKLKSGTNVVTLAGEKIAVRTSTGVPRVDFFSGQSDVVTADVSADNGIIHAVDTVLIPPTVFRAMAAANSGGATQ